MMYLWKNIFIRFTGTTRIPMVHENCKLLSWGHYPSTIFISAAQEVPLKYEALCLGRYTPVQDLC